MTPPRTASRTAAAAWLLLALWLSPPTGALAGDCAGPPIAEIAIESAAPVDEDEILRLVPLRLGQPLCPDDLSEARRLIDLTGLFESVDAESRESEGSLLVTLRLVRWPIVNSVSFRGNRDISTDELHRTSHLGEGDLLRKDRLDQIQLRLIELYRDQAFADATVAIATRPADPGELAVTVIIDEGKPLMIGELMFTAEPEIDPTELADEVGLGVGDRYVGDRVKQANRDLLRWLRQESFLEAEVESTWEPIDRYRGRLRFDVRAGPRFLFEIKGNQHLSQEEMLKLMNVDKRAVITDGSWREMARRGQQAYAEKGYYFATVRLSKIEKFLSPPSLKVVSYEVEEGECYHLDSVVFRGNQNVPSSVLLDRMETHTPSWVPWYNGYVVPAVLDADLERIRDTFAHRGFPDATVAVAAIVPDEQRHELRVEIEVVEQSRELIRSLQFSGIQDVDLVKPMLSSKAGQPHDPAGVEADARTLLAALKASGYLDAEVKTDTAVESTPTARQADVTFQVSPGRRQRVGALVVSNNVDTRARVILREMTVQPGDVIQPSALLDDQRRIYQLNLFRSVSVAPAEQGASEDHRDVLIDVRERAPGTLQWGLGYDTRDGFHSFGQIGYSNLQGVGRRLSLRGEISVETDSPEPSQYFADLGYFEPRLLETRWDLRVDLIAERAERELDDFSVQRVALVPAVERTLVAGVRVGADLIIEDANVFRVDQDIRDEPGFHDQRRLQTISIGPFLIRDSRDDSFMPTRGSFESLVVRYAPGAFGSSISFVKVVAHHSQYVPLPAKFTFAYALRSGWATTVGTDEHVPIRERFFLGGRTTVRGFGENRVGPRATTSDGKVGSPLGGDLVFNGNLELLLPPLFGVRVALFTDAGAVYLQDRAIEIDGFRESAGPGLRYGTPVGSISLDYGFKLDPRGNEAPGAVHFSIGAIF